MWVIRICPLSLSLINKRRPLLSLLPKLSVSVRKRWSLQSPPSMNRSARMRRLASLSRRLRLSSGALRQQNWLRSLRRIRWMLRLLPPSRQNLRGSDSRSKSRARQRRLASRPFVFAKRSKIRQLVSRRNRPTPNLSVITSSRSRVSCGIGPQSRFYFSALS